MSGWLIVLTVAVHSEISFLEGITFGTTLGISTSSVVTVLGTNFCFFQKSPKSLWEKPIWEGVLPCLDPMESVCLRTASVEWNVPGKYGPRGELFFFLMQKEPATMPGT